MQHKTLKLSTLAVLIAGATQANAAVYKVVEVDPSGEAVNNVVAQGYENKSLSGRVETYAEAIEASTGLNCFDSGAGCTDDQFKVVGESRVGTDGINYRDEVAFTYDNYHEVNDYFGFLSYCSSNLGFNTCNTWATQQYYGLDYNEEAPEDGEGFGGLHREHAAWSKGYFANALPFAEVTSGSSTNLARVETFASDVTTYATDAVAQLGNIVSDSSQETANGVVSGLGSLSGGSEYTFGVSSSAYFEKNGRYARQFSKRGFVNLGTESYALNTPVTSDTVTQKMGQTVASGAIEFDDGTGTNKLLVVGSASFDNANFDDDRKLPDSDDDGFSLDINKFKDCAVDAVTVEYLYSNRECQHAVFANDAYIWTVDSTNGVAEPILIAKRTLNALDPDENDRSFQGAARAVSLVDKDGVKKPVIVGYSTQSIDNDYYAITATIFEPKAGITEMGSPLVAEGWERKPIPGIDIEQGSDRKYRYTIATDINTNNQVVGVAKNFSSQNRSYAETMFVYDNNNSTLKFLDTAVDSSIFFSGYNGFPAAINNHDQLVGWIDTESVNQVDGRQRRQRAFTYMAGAGIPASSLEENKAWLLDDLTHGGEAGTANNAFRIARATDINDAGVISATAFKCEGGYQSATKKAQCSQDEKVVAVKLIPIPGGKIEQRPDDNSSISRSGAGFGLFGLTLLGLIGVRRRK